MRGDAAVKEYTAKFDRVELGSVCVPIDVRTSPGPFHGAVMSSSRWMSVGCPSGLH